MKSDPDQGFASTQFLFTIVLISSISLGLGLYQNAYRGIENRAKTKMGEARNMRSILNSIVLDMGKPNRADINSFEDPLWSWDGAVTPGYRISINPISDKINLNYIGRRFMEQSNLLGLFNRGSDPESLGQYRYTSGLSLSLDAYDRFFSPETLDSYFTCYGWANINLVDEFSAEYLALTLTGSERASADLRTIIQDARLKRTLITRETLKTHLGMDYEKLFPHINAEPMININFIPPGALRTLISYPLYGVKNPDDKVREIIERRRSYGIGREELWEILEINDDHPLAGCLGAITWFWEVTIAGKGKSLRAIICRFPSDPHRYSIIEMREL